MWLSSSSELTTLIYHFLLINSIRSENKTIPSCELSYYYYYFTYFTLPATKFQREKRVGGKN